MSNW